MTAIALIIGYIFALFIWWRATKEPYMSKRIYTIVVFTIILIAASIVVEDKPKPFVIERR